MDLEKFHLFKVENKEIKNIIYLVYMCAKDFMNKKILGPISIN